MPFIIGGMAAVGGIAGAMKSGPQRQQSELERQAQMYSQQSLNSFANLVKAGPGAADVTRGVQSQRDLATLLQGYQANGLYDMSKGNQIASQAFAGQRMALSQAFQDQLQQASKSAQLAGRSSNDPIVRAKLAQEQMRQSAMLEAQQGAAAVDFGRQFSIDRIGNASNATSILAGLGSQAFSNQANLFQMGQGALMNERSFSLADAQYEQSRGGGVKGAIEGALAGAGAGMQMSQGFGAGGGGKGAGGAQMQASAPSNAFAGFQFGQASPNTMAAMSGVDSSYGYAASPALRAPARTFAPAAPAYGTGDLYGPPSPAPGSGSFYGPPNPFRR